VARVEEDLVKMIQGGPYEEVRTFYHYLLIAGSDTLPTSRKLHIFGRADEELVDFCEWMVDEDNPNGVTFTDELELVRKHPEYLDLSSDAGAKGGNGAFSSINTPLATDIGSEGESQGGLESAQRSLAPTPSPGTMSPADPDDDKEVDDFEDDLLRDMEEKAPAPPPAEAKRSYLEDPAYHQLTTTRDRLQKSLRDADRSISEYAARVEANSNIVMKVLYTIELPVVKV
jgi:hypothetical protein